MPPLHTDRVRIAMAALAMAAASFARVQPGLADERLFEVAAVLRHETALAGAHDVELRDNLAFVAGRNGSVAIVEISRPEAPGLVWYAGDPERLHRSETVLPTETHLFLGTNDFISIDISDPHKPAFKSWLCSRPRIDAINGMVRRGSYVFAANKRGWIAAFDVSDPDLPRLAGALNVDQTFDIRSPHDIDLRDGHLVVPDARGFGKSSRTGKLAVLQVLAEPGGALLPAEEWKLAGQVESQELIGANRVAVSGSWAYVGGSQGGTGKGRFTAVDLSELSRPVPRASLPFSDACGPNGLTVAGRVVFLGGGQTVEAIDVSDPARPVKFAVQHFPDMLSPGPPGNVHDLVYRDGWLYVTAQSDHCLLILRTENARLRALAERAAP